MSLRCEFIVDRLVNVRSFSDFSPGVLSFKHVKQLCSHKSSLEDFCFGEERRRETEEGEERGGLDTRTQD